MPQVELPAATAGGSHPGAALRSGMIAAARRTRLLSPLLTLGLLGAAPATRPAPPRYRLAVGQELTYAFTSTEDAAADPAKLPAAGRSTAVYRVVGRSPDGSGWHVVATLTGADSGQVDVSAFDLWPDGRQSAQTPMGTPANPAGEFPRLPPTADADHWDQPTAEGDEVFRPVPPTTQPAAPGTVAYAAESQSPLNGIYGVTDTETDTFDPARGLMVRSAGTLTQTYGTRLHQNWSRDLKADTVRPADEAARYGAQAAAALDAIRDYSRAMVTAVRAADPAAVAQAAVDRLTAARSAVTDPVLAGLITDAIAQHGDDLKDLAEERQARDALVGHPAPAFDLPDLAGVHHTLADQRGKVVVLDFWYRGCPWCMHDMPDMRALADADRGRPVAVLGMNNDVDPKDAAFVADFFHLPYPALLMMTAAPTSRPTAPTADAYHVQAFPTVVVVGPDGVVRDVFVGYTPTINADLKRTVDALLSAPRAAG